MKGYIKRGRVEDSWYIRVELPRDAKGARRQRRETVRGAKADAQRRLRALLREVETGGYADSGRMSVTDVAARWLAATKHRVGVKTYVRYESIVRLHLTPSLGGVRAEALRPAHIEAALADWMSGARKDRESGTLSARTVKHILDTLRSICRWAVKMGVLVRNPVDAIEPPRVSRPEMRDLNPVAISRLLDAARGSDLEAPIAVAVGRTLSSSLLDVYRQSYVRTARAKGLTETRVLLHHTLRNAAGPALSMLSLQVALVFSNLLIVERLFSWPGLGLYTVQAFASADLPAVLGVALVVAGIYLATAAVIDVVRALLDPRLSLR